MKIDRRIAVDCPKCDAPEKIYIDIDFSGDTVKCPACGEMIQISPEWRRYLWAFKNISPDSI